VASVMFICPTYLQEVDAGIDIDDQTFRRSRLEIVRAQCPHCQRDHRFLLADARLEKVDLTHAALPVEPIGPRLSGT
jgi:hypothetical protein